MLIIIIIVSIIISIIHYQLSPFLVNPIFSMELERTGFEVELAVSAHIPSLMGNLDSFTTAIIYKL